MRAKRAGDWERSAQRYAIALNFHRRDAPTWVQYGNSLKEAGRLAAAEAAYRRAIALDERLADAHLQLGHALKLQRRGHAAAAAYGRALALEPQLHDASLELIGLGSSAHVARAAPAISAATAGVVFDVSDVLHHFLHHRLPSGIQRVQLNVVLSLLHRGRAPLLACFAGGSWVSVPEELFRRLAGLAIAGGRTDALEWRDAVGSLIGTMYNGDALSPPPGAALVDLGTAAGRGDYFLALRDAKDRHGIGYFPFVHDCIPVVRPQDCTPETVRNYNQWLTRALLHADGFLTNSAATAADLTRIAGRLGHPIEPPRTILLAPHVAAAAGQADAAAFLSRHGLDRQSCVLFVSTFEPRKNHLLAFRCWLRLIEKRGPARTPLLVCVGDRSWMVEKAMALLRREKRLRRRVRLLHGVGDAQLAALYRACLFTLYPSSYEGWGSPVTESLCYGKVPVIAAVSALPEAGGEFAAYFSDGSEEALVEAIERLLDDPGRRVAMEAKIHAGFRPRSWDAVADDILDWVASQQSRAPVPFAAEPGAGYVMSRGRDARLDTHTPGDVFRAGAGWWAPEDWGCRLKDASAAIAFTVAPGNARAVAVGLRGLPRGRTDFAVQVVGGGPPAAGSLAPDEERWVSLPLDPAASTVRIAIAAPGTCDLAEISDGMDRRVVRLGILGFRLEN